MRRYAKRRDESEPAIVAALKAAGVWVKRMDPPFPDLLLWAPWFGYQLAEVKMPGKPRNDRERRRGGLTDSQIRFHGDCPGPIPIWKTPDEAVAWVEAQR